MKPYVIVVCSSCNGLLVAKTKQKTKTCPYCGSRITLSEARHKVGADNVFEASRILKALKTKASDKTG